MPEETVWRGTSSQWKNSGAYFIWGLASLILICISVILRGVATGGLMMIARFLPVLLIVPLVVVVSRFLQTKSRVYELTNERLKTTEGVFGKATDTLELYRVKDIEARQPFFYRMVGVENVLLNTSDASSPSLLLDAIPCPVKLPDQIRNQVETMRQQKRVREIDIE
jgi:uncharacterized membrane protein YdbT with pleckstrin-like domain